MAPGHPGAVGTRGGVMGAFESAKTVGQQGGSPADPPLKGFLSFYLRFGAPNNQPAGERDEEDKTIYTRHGSGDRGAQRLE